MTVDLNSVCFFLVRSLFNDFTFSNISHCLLLAVLPSIRVLHRHAAACSRRPIFFSAVGTRTDRLDALGLLNQAKDTASAVLNAEEGMLENRLLDKLAREAATKHQEIGLVRVPNELKAVAVPPDQRARVKPPRRVEDLDEAIRADKVR